MTELQTKADFGKYVDKESIGYVCVCGTAFTKKRYLKQHCNRKLSKCKQDQSAIKTVYLTTCGRTLSCLKEPSIRAVLDFSCVTSALVQYLREDEKESFSTYAPMLFPLVDWTGNHFDQLRTLIGHWETVAIEPDILHVCELAHEWLVNRARYEVGLVPGNYRAALLVFEGQDMAEVSQNFTNHFRHKESVLILEVNHLIAFVWRSEPRMILDFKTSTPTSDKYFVPKLLCYLLLQKVNSVTDQPIVV